MGWIAAAKAIMFTVLSFSLFFMGLIIGSFLNVVILRFEESRGFFHWPALTGRSRCPHCRKILRWHELIPLVSFLSQKGRCRRCRKRLTVQYPLVEFLSGLIFLLPIYFYSLSPDYLLFSAILIMAALTLLTLSVVDLQRFVIPDQLNFFLGFLGAAAVFAPRPESFLGPAARLAGFFDAPLPNRLLGAAAGFALLGLIYFLSRGRAMGFGDVKLAAAIGLLLGWPDVFLALALSFVIGALFGIFWILTGRKKFKSAVPFGPFLAAGTMIVILFGRQLVGIYFNLFNFI